MLAIIPARSGSKGLPGKNIRPLAGLPLLAHSVRCAQRCSEIDRLIVSTDSEAIAEVARDAGADIPFLRPAALAQDDTPMWPVLQHALHEMEQRDARAYASVLLLDPTSPGRLPEDIAAAAARLAASPAAEGIVGVSEPEFNPLWHCVVERDGWMQDLLPGAEQYGRRQDVPTVYRINASLYLWRRALFAEDGVVWRHRKMLLHPIPERRAIHIDTMDEFQRTDLLIRAGLLSLPWLP